MLALERRPVEPRARAMYIDVRDQTLGVLGSTIRDLVPGLTDAQVHQLATYALAGGDGLFVAKEIGGDSVDLLALLELHITAVYDTAERMVAENTTDRKGTP